MIVKAKGGLRLGVPATASLWYISSNIIARGATFFFTPLFTRLLSPTEYGVYSLYISLMGIFTVVTTLEISGTLIYRALSRFSGHTERLISSFLGVQTLLSAISLVLYLLFFRSVNALTGLSTHLSVLLIMQVFLNSVEGLYFAKKRYAYEYKRVSLINIISGIASPFLALIFIKTGYSAVARMIAPFIISLAVAVPIIYYSLKNCRVMFWREGWSFIFKTALPMLPHFLALSVMAQGDKIVIARLMGEVAVGKYSVAYSAAVLLLLVSGGISLSVNPFILKNMGERVQKIRTALDGVSRLLAIIILLFLSLIPEVFAIIAPSEYYDAFSVIYPVAVSVLFYFLATTLSTAILHYEKPLIITRNSLFSATVSVFLCIFLVNRLGILGGAYSTLISYILLFILNLFSSRTLVGDFIITLRRCVNSILLLICFAVLLFALRVSAISRLLVIIALLIMLIRESGGYIKALRER